MTTFRSFPHLFLPILAAVVALATGCATDGFGGASAANPNPAAWRPRLPADLAAKSGITGGRALRPDDQVEVAIHTPVGEHSGRVSDVVDPAGMITLPQVGDIKVGGLTTSDAEKVIRDAYVSGGIYQRVEITVVCKNMITEQVFYVTGATRKTGSFPWVDNLTLRRAVIQAGDVNEFGNKRVDLTRGGITTTYDLEKIDRGAVEDPKVLPGDIIKAQERWL